jgi:hypothetical protein
VTIGVWIAQVVAAGILIVGAFPKFFAYEEGPVNLAEALGVGKAAVLAIGGFELLAAALLLAPRTHAIGGALALGVMGGALVSHATTLGFSGDLGSMWILAAVAFVAAGVVLVLRRRELPVIGSKL